MSHVADVLSRGDNAIGLPHLKLWGKRPPCRECPMD